MLVLSPSLIRVFAVSLGVCCFAGCKRVKRTTEHVDAEEREIAKKLQPAANPVQKEIAGFQRKVRESFGSRRFDDLEKVAKDLRATKAIFGNGTWKLYAFYDSFTGRDKNEEFWEQEEILHKAWMTAQPDSLTARLAYADFFVSYAWHARGSGYANTVTPLGQKLMMERLAAAAKMLDDARSLTVDDPVWWSIALRVALGQGWPREEFDAVVDDAHAFDPHFWPIDTSRAYSLLPRWYGNPGDWEAYAAQVADRPEGTGAEGYARIVISMLPFHENVFRNSKASWPRTHEGLKQLRQKYPDAIEFTSYAALLATMAFDRDTAKAMFEALGDTYLHDVWGGQERFAHYRKWAQTGQW